MKKILSIICAALMLAACTSDDCQTTSEFVTVSLGFDYYMEEMTRAELSASCTRLDVWVVNGDEVLEVHQASTDDGFGNVSFTLNKYKTYNIYALAHKSASAGTLNGTVVSFADNKTTDMFWYTTSFSPSSTTNLSCTMTRNVGCFRLDTSDPVPDQVDAFLINIYDCPVAWDVHGYATTEIDRMHTIHVTSRRADGSVLLSVYIFPSTLDAESKYNIKVDAVGGNDLIKSHTFNDVSIKAGYRTTYHGNFFDADAAFLSAFSIDNTWTEQATIEF